MMIMAQNIESACNLSLQFLLKPLMEEHTGIPFKNLLLDGPVLPDMTFDPTQDHVYAMTPETVSMVYSVVPGANYRPLPGNKSYMAEFLTYQVVHIW